MFTQADLSMNLSIIVRYKKYIDTLVLRYRIGICRVGWVGGLGSGSRDAGGRRIRLQDNAVCKTKQSKHPRRATERILALTFSPR